MYICTALRNSKCRYIFDVLSHPSWCSALCQTLVAQNRAARGDKLEGKMWAKEIINDSTEELGVAEKRARSLYSPEVATANLKAIAGFSRNFLPLLFNLFVASTPERRGDLQVSSRV